MAERWSWLKWTLGIAAGAVIGAVSVEAYNKYVKTRFQKNEEDDGIAGNPMTPSLSDPNVIRLLSPVVPSFTPQVTPLIQNFQSPYGALPYPMANPMLKYAPQVERRRKKDEKEGDPEVDEETTEILSQYGNLEDYDA